MHVDKLSPDMWRELQLNTQRMVEPAGKVHKLAGKVHKLDGNKN